MKFFCLICLTLALGISKPLSVSLAPTQPPAPVVTMADVSGLTNTPITLNAVISTPFSNIAKLQVDWGDGSVSTFIPNPQNFVNSKTITR